MEEEGKKTLPLLDISQLINSYDYMYKALDKGVRKGLFDLETAHLLKLHCTNISKGIEVFEMHQKLIVDIHDKQEREREKEKKTDL